MSDLKNERPSGVIFKHKENGHKSEEMKIRIKIIKKFRYPLSDKMSQCGNQNRV